MQIKHDLSYLPESKVLLEAGFAHDVVKKICFQGHFKLNEGKFIKQIADHLEENYKMYQYVKDNGVKFKEEDLFFWTNDTREELLYFDVNVRADTLEKHNEIVQEIVKYIEDNYSNTEMYVRLQYSRRENWDAINEFLKQDFDLNNLPIEKLQPLYREIQYSNGFTKESVMKLRELSNSFLDQFTDKKVLLNGGELKGTIRKLGDHFGLFKPRARKTYYHINLGVIKSLTLI